jgi:hypothetical protein
MLVEVLVSSFLLSLIVLASLNGTITSLQTIGRASALDKLMAELNADVEHQRGIIHRYKVDEEKSPYYLSYLPEENQCETDSIGADLVSEFYPESITTLENGITREVRAKNSLIEFLYKNGTKVVYSATILAPASSWCP